MNFIFKFSYKAHFNEVKINIKEKKRDIFQNKGKLFNEAFYKISSFIVHI